MGQTVAMYITVRVDFEAPDDVTAEEAKELAMSEFDYDFKLNTPGYEVVDTEICGENK